MSETVKWAVLGVVATAVEDRPESVECIEEGFESREDAVEYAEKYAATPEKDRRLVDLYWASYAGERWQHQGGRCFIYARWTLKQDYDKLQKLGAGADPPVVVIGECDLKGPIGGIVRGRHAWIEAGNFVIDCGSYLWKLTYHEKEKFYAQRKVEVVRKETLQDILAAPQDE